MRDLSATLKAEQAKYTMSPLVRIVLTLGETEYTYTSDRILDILHTEEPYSQKATLVLDNADYTFNDLALQGFGAVISYGAFTPAGNEYSATAPLWVIGQKLESVPGKLDCTLELVGTFDLMAEDKANASYIPDSDDVLTVKALIDDVMDTTLACFNHCSAITVEWDAGYDGLADTYVPKDSFRVYIGDSRLAALKRLLDYTGNVARVESDGKVHILKPTVTGEVYDSEYSLSSGHTFFSKAYRKRVVIPGYIVVQSQPDDAPSYSGTAQDTGYDDLPAALKKRDYHQMRLASDAQAAAIAAALLAKHQLWSEMGSADIPMNVGAEIFDYVLITDARENGSTRTGNLGHLSRHYNADKAEWRMTFSFGDWMTVNKALSGLGVSADDIQNSTSRMKIKNLSVENIQAGNINFEEFDLDDLPNGTSYQRAKSSSLDADGLIILDEVYIDSEEGTYDLVARADLSAHHLNLTSDFKINGVSQTTVGVWIDSTDGISIKGTKMKFISPDGLESHTLYEDNNGYLRVGIIGADKFNLCSPDVTNSRYLGTDGLTWLSGYVGTWTVKTQLNVVDIVMSGQAKTLRIENRTTDPGTPSVGQMWLRTDL